MTRGIAYRRKQRHRKIRHRLNILIAVKKWHFDPEWSRLLQEPGRLDKFNLVCSCGLCASVKWGNHPERTKPKYRTSRYAEDDLA